MPSARDTVLLLTHSGDHFTIDRVAEEVERRGLRPVRFDTDDFPTALELTTALGPEGFEASLRTPAGELRAEEIRAAWLRRLVSPQFDDSLEPAWKEACVRESRAGLDGFLDALGATGCRFINPLAAAHTAGNKVRQLRLARELGLEIPRTVVTNDAARVRTFFKEVKGRAVAKMMTALSQSMDASLPFVYTSELLPEMLDDLEDGLRYSPMIFQERIDKARELRVVVVGGRCFVGAMDASGSSAGQVDWRRARPDECHWQAGQLPDEVALRLGRLVKELGLVYGAADIIVTPDGRHVFLEVNPGGEWGMLEHELGLPIAAALAEALAGDGGTEPRRT